jgi:hypothetical protein
MMGQKFTITENEKKEILSLYEQETKVQAAPLTNQTFENLDDKLQRDIMNSLYNNQILKDKLRLPTSKPSDFNLISYLNNKGVSPYIFMKHVPGTGEKFGMMGVYVDLFGEDVTVKLNVNNISEYLINSLPWALVSLNVRL